MPCGGIYPIANTWVEELEKNLEVTGRMDCSKPNLANPPRAESPVVAIDVETNGVNSREIIPRMAVGDSNFEPMMDCWHCGKEEPKPDHFCDEWDCYLHGACVKPFLETDEGKLVLMHQHRVTITIGGKTEHLYDER